MMLEGVIEYCKKVQAHIRDISNKTGLSYERVCSTVQDISSKEGKASLDVTVYDVIKKLNRDVEDTK